jgi:hypothetical protein
MTVLSKIQYNCSASQCKTFLGQYPAKFFSAESWLLNILFSQPPFQNFDYVVNLLFCQRFALGNVMPLFQTFAAACAGGMLCDENRMVPHRCLSAVVSRIRLCQAPRNKISGVLKNCCQAFSPKIFCFFAGKSKPTAKSRPT